MTCYSLQYKSSTMKVFQSIIYIYIYLHLTCCSTKALQWWYSSPLYIYIYIHLHLTFTNEMISQILFKFDRKVWLSVQLAVYHQWSDSGLVALNRTQTEMDIDTRTFRRWVHTVNIFASSIVGHWPKCNYADNIFLNSRTRNYTRNICTSETLPSKCRISMHCLSPSQWARSSQWTRWDWSTLTK